MAMVVDTKATQNSPSGINSDAAKAIDDALRPILSRYEIPGAAVAVTLNGRLMVARGYGFADTYTQRQISPDTQFRIASLTKPVAAITALMLVDQGRLDLDQPVMPILKGGFSFPLNVLDPNAGGITVRHLLRHTADFGPRERAGGGGFEVRKEDANALAAFRNRTGRPPASFRERLTAAAMGPMRSEPGSEFRYSTFGTCMLGRVIETIEGQTIDQVWSRLIISKLGGIRIGLAQRGKFSGGADEAIPYDYPGAPRVRVTESGFSTDWTRPDAYFPRHGPDECAAGGRIVMSAPDYLRVILAARGTAGSPLLSTSSSELLFARSRDLRAGDDFFTHGLFSNGRGSFWHTGGMPGAATMFGMDDRIAFVVLMNRQPTDREIYVETYRAMWNAIRKIGAWPNHNLFEN